MMMQVLDVRVMLLETCFNRRDSMVIEDIKTRVSTLKTIVHYLSIDNVNNLTKKEFDLLREIETKMGEFLNENDN